MCNNLAGTEKRHRQNTISLNNNHFYTHNNSLRTSKGGLNSHEFLADFSHHRF